MKSATEIILDATGEYCDTPDTYVILTGSVDVGREIVASGFPTIAEAQAWIDRFGGSE